MFDTIHNFRDGSSQQPDEKALVMLVLGVCIVSLGPSENGTLQAGDPIGAGPGMLPIVV